MGAITMLMALCLCLCCAGLNVPAVRPRCTIIMKKGRHQGGGPAISTKTVKRRSADVRRETVRVMQAEKASSRVKHKQPELQRQRQQDRHSSLLAMGASPLPVFARVEPVARADFTEDIAAQSWMEVGAVSFDDSQETSAEQAVWLHKRLILEHACRCCSPRCSPPLPAPLPPKSTPRWAQPSASHRTHWQAVSQADPSSRGA